jgi:hypothetical protein
MQAQTSVGFAKHARQMLRVTAWCAVAFCIYALSTGPVWLAAKHAGLSDDTMRKFYYPLTLFGRDVTDRMGQYVEWWNPPNYTLGVSNVCEIHHVEMMKTNVPIQYGLIGYSDWALMLQAASTNSFPHARGDVPGGCIVGHNSPRQALIYVCPQCLKAQEQWISKHPTPK